ncbi:sensor histidine kinase [Streptomyces althioticus]|uniref:sensor histidine kinase n=2 Tax=Streptomyces TaxID=1883 RepID=UPI0037993138
MNRTVRPGEAGTTRTVRPVAEHEGRGFGGMSGPGYEGRRRTRTGRADIYGRGIVYAASGLVPLVSVCIPVLLAVPAQPLPLVLAGLVTVVASALAGAGIGAVRQALACHTHRGTAPWTRLELCAGLLVLLLATFVGFAALVGPDGWAVRTALLFAPVPFATPLAMVVPVRVYAVVSGTSVLLGAALLAVAGQTGAAVASASVIMLTGFLLSACVGRFGAWSLSLLRELERAEGTEARLAVAEEQLRFESDVRDGLGRKLTVMALESELAVQMARRGRPEAVDRMVEVQRLARDARGEAYEAVRGHRKAGLRDELMSVAGVLEASGVRCRIFVTDLPELPGDVRSSLARVVREGTTDVLRYGNAQWCEITLAVTRAVAERWAVLTVEHDGAPVGPPGTAGFGLAGLRGHLEVLDGTLRAEAGEGTYRLTAEVPLEEVTA